MNSVHSKFALGVLQSQIPSFSLHFLYKMERNVLIGSFSGMTKYNKRLRLHLSSTLWAEFRSHCENISEFIYVCLRPCGSQCGRQKQNFAVRWCSKFFSIFYHSYSPFNPVFYCELKNIKIFEIGPKLTFLDDVFTGTIFLKEGMWRDCEKFSEFI